MSKVRVEANITTATKRRLDEIIAEELEKDRRQERPERSKSAILEMVLMMGCSKYEGKAT